MDEDALIARLGRRGAVLALVGVELVHLGRLALGEADEVVVVRLADDLAWRVVSVEGTSGYEESAHPGGHPGSGSAHLCRRRCSGRQSWDVISE